MRKYTLFIFGLFILLLGVNKVDALCDYAKQAELNAQVANMNFHYEFDERFLEMGSIGGEEVPVMLNYIKVYVYNLTEDLKLTVQNIKTKERSYYTYKDVVDGLITINIDDVSEVSTYEFLIYPEDTTCGTDELRIHTMRLPMFNTFSYLAMCDETPDFYLCQKFIDTDKTMNEFVKERDNYLRQLSNDQQNDEDDEGALQSVINFLSKYKFVIIGVVIVVGGVVAYVVIKKKRSSIFNEK